MMQIPDKWFYMQDMAALIFYFSTRNERPPVYGSSPFCVDEYVVDHGTIPDGREPHSMNYTPNEGYIPRGGVE